MQTQTTSLTRLAEAGGILLVEPVGAGWGIIGRAAGWDHRLVLERGIVSEYAAHVRLIPWQQRLLAAEGIIDPGQTAL